VNELALNIRTMSSREIAELLESRHDKVKQSIERLAATQYQPDGITIKRLPVIDLPPMGEYLDTLNRPAHEYRLDKRSSLIVVAQLSPEFTARVVDRWQQLEAELLKPALPSTYLDALKELVATVEAKQLLEAENGVLRPKALIVDRINDAEGLHTMAEAAKILGTGRTRLFQFLRHEHIFDCHNMPLQQYIPNRFVVKERPYMRGDERSVYAQVYVTGRGITWLTPKVAGLGPDGQGEFFE
jgi:phage regulator Rha-like protein